MTNVGTANDENVAEVVAKVCCEFGTTWNMENDAKITKDQFCQKKEGRQVPYLLGFPKHLAHGANKRKCA
jgi:hypothetical protein